MDLCHWNNMKVMNLLRIILFEVLELELCWWCSFFLYWLFPHGSQSSQIISENFMLNCLKIVIKTHGNGSYKTGPVRLSICLSVHLSVTHLLSGFFNFCLKIFCHDKKRQSWITEICICCLDNLQNETNLNWKWNIWHINKDNITFCALNDAP